MVAPVSPYSIVPYQPIYRQGVDDMLASIAAEFEETIYGPGTGNMDELSAIAGRSYWVLLHNGNTVGGTVGIAMIGNGIAVLKGMMLHAAHRGANKQLSLQMLHTAEQAARANGATIMYLGTMLQMKAAHRFYEKHGYTAITEAELPAGFPANPVDKVFYRKGL
jgi:N-acetylglutamate synthase and related acetyltransferases